MSDEESTRDSGTLPYLYDSYGEYVGKTFESAIYRTAPEMESQFKKPYLHNDHVTSEREFAIPGWQPFYPDYPGGPHTSDCHPQGDAVGGGPDLCGPGISCGQWSYTCAHKITSFTAVGGIIQSVQYNPSNDTVVVTACWDESRHGLTINAHSSTGEPSKAGFNKEECGGLGHSPECPNCAVCNTNPTISHTTHQMSCNGTQAFSATGGGGGPYKWSITSGGGSLSNLVTKSGQITTYTAPSSNMNCTNNPTIQVKDFCGLISTIKIAVNCFSGSAFYRCHQPAGGYPDNACLIYYVCDGSINPGMGTTGHEPCAAFDIQCNTSGYVPMCFYVGCYPDPDCCPTGPIVDLRGSGAGSLLEQGCCPEVFL